jgi:hypothetical protein
MDFPHDSDGDGLRGVEDAGADMTRPMIVDFTVATPNERSARNIAELVEAQGFDPSISDDEDGGSWSVYCSISMLLTYDGVVAVQAQLNKLLESHGGHCDGWATFGNGGSAETQGSNVV